MIRYCIFNAEDRLEEYSSFSDGGDKYQHTKFSYGIEQPGLLCEKADMSKNLYYYKVAVHTQNSKTVLDFIETNETSSKKGSEYTMENYGGTIPYTNGDYQEIPSSK